MIKQIPEQLSTKDLSLSIDSFAAKCNLENYSAVVRGPWKLLRGTNTAGKFTTVLVGPYPVTSNLVGVQILMSVGFSDVDAMMALGVHRNEYRAWLKGQRARLRETKAQSRRGSTTALDDLGA